MLQGRNNFVSEHINPGRNEKIKYLKYTENIQSIIYIIPLEKAVNLKIFFKVKNRVLVLQKKRVLEFVK